MNDDYGTEQRKNPRGSSPPDVPTEHAPENMRGRVMGDGREDRRWTIWKAAYKLRRTNTLLRILGPPIKGAA